MITVYRSDRIPKTMQIIKHNDTFFNKETVERLDDRARDIISQTDQADMITKYMIRSRFDGLALNTDKLSTGCKTVLNIIYHPDVIFDIRECGDNVIDMIYSLESGNITCDYPLISFDMEKVMACDGTCTKEIDSYEELRRWWTDED
ncbi:MAG: DUF4869 domain-containing protein [Eubacteriales bacterium]|nr:DUF4869 domain-containing protein [Eubacteriales bacterium]